MIVTEPWRSLAACRDVDPAVFFPAAPEEAEEAKAVCERCPAEHDCLLYALKTRQDDGVWGGKTEGERRKLLRLRSRRPPPEPPDYRRTCRWCGASFVARQWNQAYCRWTCRNEAAHERERAKWERTREGTA